MDWVLVIVFFYLFFSLFYSYDFFFSFLSNLLKLIQLLSYWVFLLLLLIVFKSNFKVRNVIGKYYIGFTFIHDYVLFFFNTKFLIWTLINITVTNILSNCLILFHQIFYFSIFMSVAGVKLSHKFLIITHIPFDVIPSFLRKW